LGFLDARQGNVEGARRYYEEAVRIDPTYFVAQFDLANLLLNERQANLAVAHYQKAFEQRAQLSNSELALLLNNWGIAFLQLNQPGEAFERLQAAEKVDPELANVHLNLGNLLLRAGRPDAAEKEFQRALSLNPDLAGAQRGLAAIRAAKTSTGDH
jgi:Tfp pilus assembly protein PilF